MQTKQIIYGTSRCALREFANPKNVVGFTDLQNMEITSGVDYDDIVGGNKVAPIVSFPKDKGITVSATNATFTEDMMLYLEGAKATVGETNLPCIHEAIVGSDATITLPHKPVADTLVIQGFTSSATTPTTAGTYKLEESTGKITFADEDKGSTVVCYFEYKGTAKAKEYAVTNLTMATPFIFDATFDIYDENTKRVKVGAIRIYKAQCTSGFSLTADHNSPFAPKFEAKSKDAGRVDGKSWSLFIDNVEI